MMMPQRLTLLFLATFIVFLLSTISVLAFSTRSRNRSTRNLPLTFQRNNPASQKLSSTIGPINEDIFENITPVRIEGNSLKYFPFPAGNNQRVQVSIKSSGRPIEASVELWQTPSYTPTKYKVECEDGSENIVHSIIELPEGHPVTLAVYNTEGQEFPMEVSVAEMNHVGSALSSFQGQRSHYIEGGKAVKSYNFSEGVESVEILLHTNTRNMKCFIEILHGPNDDNQVIEVETDNADLHPFYTVIQTPGGANTLRIVNENTVEFPVDAFVRPFDTVSNEKADFTYGGPYF